MNVTIELTEQQTNIINNVFVYKGMTSPEQQNQLIKELLLSWLQKEISLMSKQIKSKKEVVN